jgi:hypothetical protein
LNPRSPSLVLGQENHKDPRMVVLEKIRMITTETTQRLVNSGMILRLSVNEGDEAPAMQLATFPMAGKESYVH